MYNKSLKGFGWNNVGPATQMVAQYYFTIGPMYLGSGPSDHRRWNCHPYSNCRKVTYIYIQNAGLLLGHRQTRWINIKATLESRPAVGAGVEESCVRSALEWCWASVVQNWPALNQQWAATLTHHWTEIEWVGLHRVYRRENTSS